MSKCFLKLDWKQETIHWSPVFLLNAYQKKNVWVLDIGFTQESRLQAIIEDWLQQTSSEQTLYFIATLNRPIADIPALPGLHPEILHQGRVHIWYYYGPTQGVFNYLKDVLDVLILTQPISRGHVEAFTNTNTLIYTLPGLSCTNDDANNLIVSPWHEAKFYPEDKSKSCIIIGAGLAGAYLARTLAESGWQVRVLEEQSEVATQGSGNRFSVLYPKLSIHHAPLTELLHLSYAFSYRSLNKYFEQFPSLGEYVELWQQSDEFVEELKSFLIFEKNWIQTDNNGFRFKSAVVDMPLWVKKLLDHPNIQLHHQSITDFYYQNNLWHVSAFEAPNLIVANGYKANQFQQTHWLGMKGMKGQMTHVKAFYPERTVYCQLGHCLPEREGVHALGASFVSDWQDLNSHSEEDEKNMLPWQQFFQRDLEWMGHWSGIRGVSLDHLPMVGPIPDEEAFRNTFSIWRHHANKSLPYQMPNLPGLYAFTGFGSRGLLTIPLLAEYLKANMQKQTFLLPETLLKALSPARFLRKRLVKGVS